MVSVLGLAVPALRAQSTATPQHGGIVFVGSSIFQFWNKLGERMAPLPVLNRALAGTVTQDWLNRVGQVAAYQPRIVVFYAGSNDISAGDHAGPIIKRTQQFVNALHAKSPDAFFYYTSINKAPEKRDRWDVVDAVNREMQEFSGKNPNHVGYIELNTVLFDAQGKVRENLFLPDGLHFRPPAYEEFARIVKPILMKAWENGVGVMKTK
jgi:lysophospholipase L1-like esterase